MALFTNRNEPTGGVPSLTADQITQLYQFYFKRPPDSREMASEQENALKYSAAGIEQQIANRASNVAGSGIRGDEGTAPITIPAPKAAPVPVAPQNVLHVISDAGPALALATPMPTSPNGVMPTTPTFQPTVVNPAPVMPGNSGGFLAPAGSSGGSTSINIGGGDGSAPAGAAGSAAGGLGGIPPIAIVGAMALAAFFLLKPKG